MDYMILIHRPDDAADPSTPGTPEFDARMADFFAYNQMLIDGGHWISGGSLQPTTTATALRRTDGGDLAVTDGPFVETKEQLGGYYVVAAADLDEALGLARKIPLPDASYEVRPLAFRPDAG
ncbi:MAG TPA: YciI family protein [Iamia sp.]|jgi:hypothetical protein|nr:YciI family protein [Iamia sp.]